MSSAQQTTSTPATRRASRSWRLWYCGLAGLAGLVIISGANPPVGTPAIATPPVPQATGGAAVRPPAASPLDEPLRLVGLAQQAYQGVRDYTCLLVKKERMGGEDPEDNVVLMSVRTEPFSVALKWDQPRKLKGQEVCYVAGRNNGQMRVRSTGALGVFGFVSIDPSDPRARQTSRHSITEAGIGNLINRFATSWQSERKLNRAQVNMAEYDYAGRRCIRVETTYPQSASSELQNQRTVVYFDKENHLPIRVECYDWPRYNGDPGSLLEVFSFANLRLNVGLSDAVFNK